MDAELLYDLELEARRQDFLADPVLVYDEEHDLYIMNADGISPP